MAIVNTKVIYNYNTVDDELSARIDALETSVGAIDVVALQESVNNEAQARTAADTAMQESITAMDTAYKAKDAELESSITELKTQMGEMGAGYAEADAALKTEITGEYTEAIGTAVEAAKAEMETGYTEAVANAKSEVEAAYAQADTDLKSEIETGYAAADTALKAEIKADYEAADETVKGLLTDEVQARRDADAVLQTAIDTEVSDRQAAITNEVTNRDNAIAAAISEYDTTTQAQIANLQAQIDGAVSTWFGDVAPTAENYPANEWTDNTAKNVHLGDLYYDNVTGYCYRYKLTLPDNVYEWVMVRDSDITKAISDAANAQATADAKVDKAQGVANAGRMLVVGDDGNVTANLPKAIMLSSESGAKQYLLSVTDAGQLQLSEVL